MMPEPSDEATKWRIRERAMFIGVALWSIIVSAVLVLRPEAVQTLIGQKPMAVVGYMLVSIGVLGAVGHISLLLIHNSGSKNYDEELTEWEG